MLDNTSTFSAGTALGLQSVYDKMALKGWDTFGTFSYATAYVLGTTSDDSPLVNKVIEPFLGDAEHSLAPKLRTLDVGGNTLCNVD